jgi:energy-coupling factor transport system substrate-specific component
VEWQVTYSALVIVSSSLVAGLGSWLLVRAMARTGVLAQFEAGREQPEV